MNREEAQNWHPRLMITATDAALYFLSLDEREAGDVTTNLKLQKLLYYAQGLHLALHGVPLFSETIEAWSRGPIVPCVYRSFDAITVKGFDPGSIPEPAREVLDEVHTVYGQFSAWRLREMTQEEPPWRETYQRELPTAEIPHDALVSYFKTQLVC